MFMCLCLYLPYFFSFFFFFNDTATTEIYTLSLHDALPISVHVDVERDARRDRGAQVRQERAHPVDGVDDVGARLAEQDRKSTRLNSSHLVISYAVFCLKKKNNNNDNQHSAINVSIMQTAHT